MKNFWNKLNLEKEPFRSPKKIIEEQNEFLLKATEETVSMIVKKYTPRKINSFGMITAMNTINPEKELEEIFRYEFRIKSSLSDYSLRIFVFENPILLYPVKIRMLHDEVKHELGIEYKEEESAIEIDTEKNFEVFLEKVLNSEYLNKIISILVNNQI